MSVFFNVNTDTAKLDDTPHNESDVQNENVDSGSESDDEASASSSKDDNEDKKHFRRHRSVEFQRHHSVTEAEHSLLF